MSTHRVAEGHDVPLLSLTVLDPQPDEEQAGGIQYGEVRYSINGVADLQAPFFDFTWKEISNEDYATVMGLFGLDAATAVAVTVYVRDSTMLNWVRMNGTALRPLPGQTVNWYLRPKDLVIRVIDLEAAA